MPKKSVARLDKATETRAFSCRQAVLRAVYALTVACLFLTDVSEAWARIGGGENFGGGGGGGEGFGGDGGGNGDLIVLLIRLCFAYPAIGLPLLGLVITAAIISANKAQNVRMDRSIRRGRKLQAAEVREQALARIKSHDPDFDAEKFIQRMKDAFLRLQSGWSQQELIPLRALISDGLQQRLQILLDMQQAQGIRNVIDQVQVDSVQIAAAASDSRFDTIHLRVQATARDRKIRVDDGRQMGPSQKEPFTEYWSFHRKPGARTRQQDGAVEGHCPNCGAPLRIVDSTRCPNCQSTVNSGEYDWVLAEITQASEWDITPPSSAIPGLSRLQERDPGFSIQHLEDRVSVVFWRIRAAEFFNDLGYASPVVQERALKDVVKTTDKPSQPSNGDDRGKKRLFFDKIAVGKVELIDVEEGSTEPFDRLRVAVRWSGVKAVGDPAGTFEILKQQAIYSEVYVLTRDHTATTDAGSTFTSAQCTACGAPIAVSKSANCQYCGTPLNTGRLDWVLTEIQPFVAQLAFRPHLNGMNDSTTDLTNPHIGTSAVDTQLAVGILARMMLVDKQLTRREVERLIAIGAQQGLTPEQVQAAIVAAQDDDQELPIPRNQTEANSYLRQLIQASFADGRISQSELTFLKRFGRQAGLSPADIRMGIARERRVAYQQARKRSRRQQQSRLSRPPGGTPRSSD